MSPADKTIVNRKIARLEKNILLLKDYQRVPLQGFLEDPTLQGAVLHYLVESIEIILDIGNHILSEEFKANPDSYADIISELSVHKVIPTKFSKENTDMARFRNRIVHVYEEVDMKEVYTHLRKAPEVFLKFSRYYLKALK